jgi:hypothetical protein
MELQVYGSGTDRLEEELYVIFTSKSTLELVATQFNNVVHAEQYLALCHGNVKRLTKSASHCGVSSPCQFDVEF